MADILLIESDIILCNAYAKAFTSAGHRVQTADNAQQAVRQMDKNAPDIIVLEPELANHDGIELLYEVRSYSDWGNIPVLIHSLSPRYAEFCRSPRAADYGIAGYLYKPHTRLEDLVLAVRRLATA